MCCVIRFARTALLLCLCFRQSSAMHPSDEKDHMGRMDKNKMMTLAEELIKDTKLKQRQVHAVRGEHNIYLTYEIGVVMGKIREKYKRMMDIYREAQDRIWNRTTIMPPGVRFFKALHWVVSMELVRAMEVDIDKLVHVLEMVPKDALKSTSLMETIGFGGLKPNMGDSSPSTPASETPAALRTGDNTRGLTTKYYADEVELKRHYREEWETSSGRDANWTLDQYYGVV